MGEARKKQITGKQVLAAHPWCVYCGAPATTIDHCPPRAFFYNNHWPENYHFPSCLECNSSTRFDEQALAYLVRFRFADENNPTLQKEIQELADALKNNQRELIAEWLGSNPELLAPEVQQRIPLDWKTINLGNLTHALLDRFLVKLGKALYFQHNGQILDGIIYTHMEDTLSPHFNDEYKAALLKIAPLTPALFRNTKPLYSQFNYRYNHSVEHQTLYVVVEFSEQLIFRLTAVSPKMEKALLDADSTITAVMGKRHDCSLKTPQSIKRV